MDICERVAHHDPSGAEWRDKYFIECATSLMDPRAAIAAGDKAWLPQFLKCITTRLNNDTAPLLPGREAASALQCLAAIARSPAARFAVKEAILTLGDRADELFNDKLLGLRSLPDVMTDDATQGPITGKSLVHNAFVVCLIRCEGYGLSAAALLELFDNDVGALISILLAVAKITTYELGVTSNCLACVLALTQPATYFTAESAAGSEIALTAFTKKVSILVKEWEAANVLDTLLPLINRRCQLWATASKVGVGATAPMYISWGSSKEQILEPIQIVECVTSLSRTLANLGSYLPDPGATTSTRQHVLVVQSAMRTFTALLTSLSSIAAVADSKNPSTHFTRLTRLRVR